MIVQVFIEFCVVHGLYAEAVKLFYGLQNKSGYSALRSFHRNGPLANIILSHTISSGYVISLMLSTTTVSV